MGIKRAQSEEFVGIVIVAVLLVVVLLMGKVNFFGSEESQASSTVQEKRSLDISSTTISFPFVTAKGIPIEELLGVYNCYTNDTADYGVDTEINITKEIREKLDAVYGVDNWALYIKSAKIELPEIYFYYDSTNSMIELVAAVKSIVQGIAGSDKYHDVSLTDLSHEIGTKSNAGDDMACNTPKPSTCDDTTENWAGAVAFISKNGNPPYNGWSDWLSKGYKKFIFISGDEEACSSYLLTYNSGFCGINFGGLRWCCTSGNDFSATSHGDTPFYVANAIPIAQLEQVPVFFVLPENLSIDTRPGTDTYTQGVIDITSQTGGDIIRIGDDPHVVEAKIINAAGATSSHLYITSTKYELVKSIDFKENFIGYDFVYPIPCNPDRIGEGVLYVGKEV